MSDLSKFDVSKQTKPTRNALSSVMGDFFSVGMQGFSTSLSHLFVSSRSNAKKNQVSPILAKYERRIRKMRRVL